LLTRNAYINFIGQLIPIPVAVFTIPLLIEALGTARFGVLALAWVVMIYFAMFNFGLGRATTKFVAEHYARGETENLPELVWSSIVFHIGLGLLGGVIFASLTPVLTESVLNIPEHLLIETRTSFYLLATSIPLVVTTICLRGILEAMQRFDLINAIKIPASTFNYLGPLLALFFVDSLAAAIGVLVISRGVVLLAYFLLCLRIMSALSQGFRFNAARMKPLIGFGGWLTISGFMIPTVSFIDRFVIGALVSLSAVTVYITPYEIIMKLTIFSASLLTVLFPTFSIMALERGSEIRRLFGLALKHLLILVAPIVGVLLSMSQELLTLWIGEELARNSAPIAEWLAIGVLINVLAQVPFTALQGVGRADVIAKLQLAQLPFYILAVWYLVGTLGVTGVAMAWTLRALCEAVTFFIAADRLLPASVDMTGKPVFIAVSVAAFLLLFLGMGPTLPDAPILKGILTMSLFGLFTLFEWLFLLSSANRKTIIGGAKSILKAAR
jgi:O-antigen/teichoic acid export membrane protein